MNNTCCFFGHRNIQNTDDIKNKLFNTVETLITNKNINTFLFGCNSQFNDLCYKIVSELKTKYPKIKRVYVRAKFPYINNEYRDYLLQSYEDTYYPPQIINSGKAAYVERNYEMINQSQFCVIYFDENNDQSKSGTKTAYKYALKKGRNIINVLDSKHITESDDWFGLV